RARRAWRRRCRAAGQAAVRGALQPAGAGRASRSDQPRDAGEDQGRRSAAAADRGPPLMPPFRDRVLPTLDLNFLGTALVIAAVGCMLIYSATYFSDPNLGIF